MNVDRILETFEKHQVDYLLIGGMNYLLNHEPELTFDVDLWIRDDESHLKKTHLALIDLNAAWGFTENEWKTIQGNYQWLQTQSLFCLTTSYGALDIFRVLKGLENQFDYYWKTSRIQKTSTGISYRSLSDEGMLACQMALPVEIRKQKRIDTLSKAIQSSKTHDSRS